MRRRTLLVATGVSGLALAFAIGIAPAAGQQARRHVTKTQTTVSVSCNVSLTATPPPNSNSVQQPPTAGRQYGPTQCTPSSLGSGVIADYFHVPDSGDTLGYYHEYFKTGEIWGAFDLTPQEGTFGSGGFTSGTWTGTITVAGGSGTYKGAKSATPGTFDCTSPDSVHLSCTETATASWATSTAG